ncbi:hypothetical protein NWP96_03485 [Mycoplasmopsis cynos]|nr:hypothetical protein [Mycoplasmopsis cynos]
MDKKVIELNNIGAVTNAIDLMMEKDSTVVLWGQDAGFEGVFLGRQKGCKRNMVFKECEILQSLKHQCVVLE